MLRWEKGGEIMQLPLRDAREVFEREYLLAQVTRFGGNISRTATFVGMERSALHRKLKSLGLHGGMAEERNGGEAAEPGSEELVIWRVTPTSTAATSIIARPTVHIEDRGYQLADGVYEVVGVRDGKPDRRGPAHRPPRPLACASCASPGRCRGRRWASSSAS